MLPPAPGRFSTTSVWPMFWLILLSMMRVTTSLALPAANGTITLIGRDGQVCACAGRPGSIAANAIEAARRTRRAGVLLIEISSVSGAWNAECEGRHQGRMIPDARHSVSVPQDAVAILTSLRFTRWHVFLSADRYPL